MQIEIPIFKSGVHTAMDGTKLTYADDDLIAMAQAYNPDVFDAPVVIGHPEHNHPAWGWVEKLSFRDGSLWATLRDLHSDFVEWVRNKQFKKISASFYLPGSQANPKPEGYYLRHIGFLGAAAPALKTLPAVNLSESDGALVYEEKMYFHPAINLMQSVKNEQTGAVSMSELGDYLAKTMKEKNVSLEAMANAAGIEPGIVSQILRGDIETPPDERLAGFAKALGVSIETIKSKLPGGKVDNAENLEEIKRLREENAQLKAQSTQYQEQAAAAQTALAERERAAVHDSHVAFCDKLITEGRLLPVNKAVTVAALDLVASQEKPLEFAEGDANAQLTIDKFKAALQSNPVIVDFSERSADKGEPAVQPNINAPTGYDVDKKGAELHSKALAYMEAHPGTEYVAAVAAVQ